MYKSEEELRAGLISDLGLSGDHWTTEELLNRATLAFTGPSGMGVGNGLESRVDTLEENTPTLEEQGLSVILDTDAVTTAHERVVYVAPFPCRLDQVALSFAAAVTASDTDYWTVGLVRYRYGSDSTIASKTTKTEASDGEAIAAYREWHFDTVEFANNEFVKGDVLVVTFTPTGAAPALSPACLTFRAPAADVTAPPEPITVVSDSFDRADGALGTADTGQTWSSLLSSWAIAGNQAVPDPAGGRKVATIDAGVADCTVQATIAVVATTNDGIALRATDASNFLYATSGQLQKRVAGIQSVVASYSSSAVSGDTIRAVLSGDTVTVYIDAGSTGAFNEVLSTTEAFNNTATQHGLYSTDATSTTRVDDFQVIV